MSEDTGRLADVLAGLLADCDGQTTGYSRNIAAAMFAVARRLGDVAEANHAIAESLTRVGERIADSLSGDAMSVSDNLDSIASAISGLGPELHGIGQEIGWGLDPDDNRTNHLR